MLNCEIERYDKCVCVCGLVNQKLLGDEKRARETTISLRERGDILSDKQKLPLSILLSAPHTLCTVYMLWAKKRSKAEVCMRFGNCVLAHTANAKTSVFPAVYIV